MQIEIINTGSVADMHVTGADLNFRLGPLDDSDLVARPLATFKFGVYAAPSYVSANGKPLHPQELPMHRTLVHKSPRSATIILGTVGRKRVRGRRDSSTSSTTWSLTTLLEAALAGAGVFRIGMFTPPSVEFRPPDPAARRVALARWTRALPALPSRPTAAQNHGVHRICYRSRECL